MSITLKTGGEWRSPWLKPQDEPLNTNNNHNYIHITFDRHNRTDSLVFIPFLTVLDLSPALRHISNSPNRLTRYHFKPVTFIIRSIFIHRWNLWKKFFFPRDMNWAVNTAFTLPCSSGLVSENISFPSGSNKADLEKVVHLLKEHFQCYKMSRVTQGILSVSYI